jgi:undecaprenyl-diphosphatase
MPFMNERSKGSRALPISLLCAAGFACDAVLVGSRRTEGFDKAVISVVQGWESPALTGMMKFFTNIGTGLPIVLISLAIMAVLYVFFRHRRELILFACVVIGSALLNTLLKVVFHRARPTLHRLYEASGFSFPSGHAMAAFSLYGVLAFLLWKHVSHASGRVLVILIAAVLILAIGVSRVYLGVHYPSDIIGGYLASGFWLALSVWLYRRFWTDGRSAVNS